MPAGLVTVSGRNASGRPAGGVKVSWVSPCTAMPWVTICPPTVTAVVPNRPVPVTVTSGGCTVGICTGVTPVICGGVACGVKHEIVCW